MKPFFDFFRRNEFQIIQWIAFLFIAIGLTVLVWFLFLLSKNYQVSANFDEGVTQTVGVFIGGVVPVFISIATVLLVYITFKSNREEFFKLNEANTYQQFSNTFETMNNEIDNFLTRSNNEKLLDEYISLFNSKIQSKIEFGVNGNDKKTAILERKNPSKRGQCFSRMFNDGELDKLLIKGVSSFNRYKVDPNIKAFESAIIMIFDFFETSTARQNNLKDKKNFYFFRIKNTLNKNHIEEALFISSIYNKKIKNFALKYDLITDAYSDFRLGYSFADKNNIKTNADYIFPIRNYFFEGILGKE